MGGRPPLTIEQIIAWADAHPARTGRRPSAASGPVAGVPGEDWRGIQSALYSGARGLPGSDTLPRLLARQRRPWTAQENEVVRTLAPRQAAERTGRSVREVYQRR